MASTSSSSRPRTFRKLSFSGEALTCYGLELVATSLRRRGHTVVDWTPDAPADDPILLSVYWPQQVFDIIRWQKNNGIAIGSRTIVAGGNTATANPAALFPWVSHVYLGDGESWDGDLDGPHVVTVDSEAKPIHVAAEINPQPYVDTQRIPRTFIELSRGCRNNCFFCQYGWLKPYRESNISDVVQLVKRRKTKSVRMFAADRFQHSAYLAARELLDAERLTDTGSDISVRYVNRHPELLRLTKKFRTGIEGMSERLRRMVAKPLADDHICLAMENAIAAGIKCFDWYMIYGLPTESEVDASAFLALLGKLAPIMRGQTLAIHWNAFQPNALTPMQWCSAAWQAPADRLRRIERRRFPGMKLTHRPLLTSSATMIERMIAVRACAATARICYNVATNRQLLKKHPDLVLREFERTAGFSAVEALPVETELPWDRYVRYDRAKVARIYTKVFT